MKQIRVDANECRKLHAVNMLIHCRKFLVEDMLVHVLREMMKNLLRVLLS